MSFSLADAIFWIAVVCCSVAQVAIVYSTVVAPGRMPGLAKPVSVARRAREIAWAVLPGVALAAVFVFTWRAMHAAHGGAGLISVMQ